MTGRKVAGSNKWLVEVSAQVSQKRCLVVHCCYSTCLPLLTYARIGAAAPLNYNVIGPSAPAAVAVAGLPMADSAGCRVYNHFKPPKPASPAAVRT